MRFPVCRTSRRWYTGTGRKAKKGIAVWIVQPLWRREQDCTSGQCVYTGDAEMRKYISSMEGYV